jgi:hypothetical protein
MDETNQWSSTRFFKVESVRAREKEKTIAMSADVLLTYKKAKQQFEVPQWRAMSTVKQR